MEQSSKKTLFHVLKPLTNLFSVYGLNWKEEPKLIWKILKVVGLFYWVLLYTVAALLQIRDACEYHRVPEGKVTGITKLVKSAQCILDPANVFCFFLCLCKWKSMVGLLERCKQFHLSPRLFLRCQRIRRGLTRSTLVCLILVFLRYLSKEFQDGGYQISDLISAFAKISIIFFSFYVFTLMMPLLAVLMSFVAHYVTATLEERRLELAHAHSPWRKARLISCLMEFNVEMKGLADKANAIGASAMFVVKSTCLILCLLNVYAVYIPLGAVLETAVRGIGASEVKDVDRILDGLERFFVFYPLMVLILLNFHFQSQHSAGQLKEQLARVILKSIKLDDERLFTSHPQLLQIRVTHLMYVTEMSMQRNYFVILNEEVTNENLISVFMEMIDLWNTINAKIPIEYFYN